VERRYLCSVDGFIFNSHTTRREVEQLVGERPHVVAHPGGDRFEEPAAVFTSRPPRPEGPLRLLFAGNLIPRKGLHVLLDALAQLPGVAWRLDVVGRAADPAYARRVRGMADRLLPRERVAWR
jgi:glycosyltransferase involved in cell wall biosynthesis